MGVRKPGTERIVTPLLQDAWTPLHVATRKDCVESIRMLIAAGANVNAKAVSVPEQCTCTERESWSKRCKGLDEGFCMCELGAMGRVGGIGTSGGGEGDVGKF